MFPNWFETQKHFFERNVPQGKLDVLQIGAYTGDATEWLLKNRDIDEICDVDTWEGSNETAHQAIDFSDVYEEYLRRHEGAIEVGVVFPHRMTSDEFFAELEHHKEGLFDFIYIDGDHTAVQVALDAFNAWNVLNSGGVMAFDDYLWVDNPDEYLRPKRGIDAFLEVCKGKYELLDVGYQVWVRKL